MSSLVNGTSSDSSLLNCVTQQPTQGAANENTIKSISDSSTNNNRLLEVQNHNSLQSKHKNICTVDANTNSVGELPPFAVINDTTTYLESLSSNTNKYGIAINTIDLVDLHSDNFSLSQVNKPPSKVVHQPQQQNVIDRSGDPKPTRDVRL